MEQIGTPHTEDHIWVVCDYKDIKELGKGSTWVVEASEFNMDTQDGDVILRPLTVNDI